MTASPAQPTLPVFLAWLEESRQRGQVHYDAHQQTWQVLGHPEAVAVLSDPAKFSSDLTGLVPAQDDLALFQKGNFVRMDPPRHRAHHDHGAGRSGTSRRSRGAHRDPGGCVGRETDPPAIDG